MWDLYPPIIRYFNYVFATENNRKAISHLHSSIKKNNFKNINIARLSDLETIEAFGGKTFRRLNNFDLKSYKFDTILVDPQDQDYHLNQLILLKSLNR